MAIQITDTALRIAKALWDRRYLLPWDSDRVLMRDRVKQIYLEDAALMLETIREPTPEMLSVVEPDRRESTAALFRSMIDVATGRTLPTADAPPPPDPDQEAADQLLELATMKFEKQFTAVEMGEPMASVATDVVERIYETRGLDTRAAGNEPVPYVAIKSYGPPGSEATPDTGSHGNALGALNEWLERATAYAREQKEHFGDDLTLVWRVKPQFAGTRTIERRPGDGWRVYGRFALV